MDKQTYKEATAALKQSGIPLPLQKEIQDAVDEKFNQGKWIPCNERLPKESGRYLVTTCSGVIHAWKFWNKGWKKSWEAPISPLFEPIAWQQLPEPYKSCTSATKEEQHES